MRRADSDDMESGDRNGARVSINATRAVMTTIVCAMAVHVALLISDGVSVIAAVVPYLVAIGLMRLSYVLGRGSAQSRNDE